MGGGLEARDITKQWNRIGTEIYIILIAFI